MEVRQIAIRIDEATAGQLKLRATIERRPVNEIIGEAIIEYVKSHPVSREHMLGMVRAIAMDDAPVLKALADA